MDRTEYHYLRRRHAELMAEHHLLQRRVPTDPYPQLAQREANASLRVANDMARRIRPARDAYTADVNQRWALLGGRIAAHVQRITRQRRVVLDLATWGAYCQQHGVGQLDRALGFTAIEWGNDTAADRIALVEARRAALGVAA